jgi:hypothetical protein
VVGETQAAFAEEFPENAILLVQVVEDLLLLAVQPSGKTGE